MAFDLSTAQPVGTTLDKEPVGFDLSTAKPVEGGAAPGGVSRPQQMAESGGKDFYPNGAFITSPKGAMGRNQVLLSTARQPGLPGVRPLDEAIWANGTQQQKADELARVGDEYMDALRVRYKGDETKALAAYNAGFGRVDRGEALSIPETRKYIKDIIGPNTLPDYKNVPAASLAGLGAVGKEGVRLANEAVTIPASAARLILSGLGTLGGTVTRKLEGSDLDSAMRDAIAANPRVTYKGFAEPSATSQLVGGAIEQGTEKLENITGNTGWARAGVDAAGNILALTPFVKPLRSGIGVAKDYLNEVPNVERLNAVIDKGVMKGVGPKTSEVKTAGQLENVKSKGRNAFIEMALNKDNLKLTDEVGNPIEGLPKSRAQASTAVESTKRTIWEKVEELNKAAGEQGATIPLQSAVTELGSVINSPVYKTLAPETASYATSVVERLNAQKSFSVAEAQEAITLANQSLKNFYKNPSPENASRSAIDSLVAKHLRSELDTALEKATGSSAARGLREAYGSVRSVEEAINRGALADAKKNNYGAIDFSNIYTAGELSRALVGLNPAIGAKAATMIAVKSLIKRSNDPNVAIANAFKAADKLASKVTSQTPRIPEVIPTPETPMAMPPEPGPRYAGEAWRQDLTPQQQLSMPPEPSPRYPGEAWRQEPPVILAEPPSTRYRGNWKGDGIRNKGGYPR